MSVTEQARTVPKPWGHELIWVQTPQYVGKILVIETGKRLSMQYHRKKDESVYVLSGRMRLHLEDDDGVVLDLECSACGRPIVWHVGVEDFPTCCDDPEPVASDNG